MVRLSTNFSLQEYTKSQTAIRQGLDNTPNEAHMTSATAYLIQVGYTFHTKQKAIAKAF